MASVSYKVQGLRELNKALMDLPKAVHRRALSPAVREAAALVRDKARANAPKDTGRLARNISSIINRKYSSKTRISADVGVRVSGSAQGGGTGTGLSLQGGAAYSSTDAYYWYFVEFGTRKMKAQPFLIPALENNQRAAITVISRRLKDEILKQAAKHGRRR